MEVDNLLAIRITELEDLARWETGLMPHGMNLVDDKRS